MNFFIQVVTAIAAIFFAQTIFAATSCVDNYTKGGQGVNKTICPGGTYNRNVGEE